MIGIGRRFLVFWYDFVVGDDPIVAIGVVLALALTALAARGRLTAWWILPVATSILLCASLIRASRAAPSASSSRGDGADEHRQP